MIATFVVEIVMLIYVLWRYKLDLIGRLAGMILFFLALFQLAEFNVCTVTAGDIWPRIGYASITMLPALGIHLAVAIAQPKGAIKYLPIVAYAHATYWVGLFAFADIFNSYACTTNYAVFDLTAAHAAGYSLFYYLWLAIALIFAISYVNKVRVVKRHQALKLLMVGYLVFLVPTFVVNVVAPETIAGIPSIMCGFAVLFALILTFGIVPKVSKVAKWSKAFRFRLPL